MQLGSIRHTPACGVSTARRLRGVPPRLLARFAAMLAAVLLAACTQPVPRPGPEAEPAAPADFPAAFYGQAIAAGEPVYAVDPARSLVVIEVRRGGSLARLGHDHVVASHDARGFVAPRAARADLYVRLADLVVDEPALRTQAGFDSTPSATDIAGTRSNMLDKVLHAERHPYALIHAARAGSDDRLAIAVTLNGVTRDFEVPMTLQESGDELRVTGTLAFDQSAFGLVPFSILGGAVEVLDRVDLRFDIRARRTRR
jgi:YceI-like domain